MNPLAGVCISSFNERLAPFPDENNGFEMENIPSNRNPLANGLMVQYPIELSEEKKEKF
jgi:hypothetical protein